jgi:hypothetical protein
MAAHSLQRWVFRPFLCFLLTYGLGEAAEVFFPVAENVLVYGSYSGKVTGESPYSLCGFVVRFD